MIRLGATVAREPSSRLNDCHLYILPKVVPMQLALDGFTDATKLAGVVHRDYEWRVVLVVVIDRSEPKIREVPVEVFYEIHDSVHQQEIVWC